MFAEEEWNDTASAEPSTQCGITVSESIQEKVTPRTGKKSLLRTLQTLGTVPEWTTCSAPKGSESEAEGDAPSHPKKKKKRIKKRKRGALAKIPSEGGDNQDGDDVPQVIKKQKISPQAKASKNVNSAESVATKQVDEGTRNSIEKALSRKQWRTRMKNKRKCKNKYQEKKPQESKADTAPDCPSQENGPDQNYTSSKQKEVEPRNVINVKPKKCKNKYQEKTPQESKADTAQDCPSQEKRPDQNDTSSKQKKVEPRNVINVKPTKSKKAKEKGPKQVTKKDSSAKPISPSKPDEVLFVESLPDTSNITKDDLDPNLSKPSEKTEPLKPSDKRKLKEKQMRADKLRQMLNSQLSKGKAAESAGNREETTEKDTGDEEEEVMKNDEGQTLDRSAALRSKMEKRLEAARFRYINEVLYTTSSSEAKRMFQQDPKAFEVYHLGFTTQVQYWPENPVDAIISFICQKPSTLVVADFGCGDCKIARSVKNKVHSFDLAPTCDLVTVCDMAKVPLGNGTVDIAVFCLSLMGTNLNDFLAEANRVLVMGGVLKIAEVASRFENVRAFGSALSSLGFKLTSKDTNNNYFFLFEFVKVGDPPGNVKKAGLTLKPCMYKKR